MIRQVCSLSCEQLTINLKHATFSFGKYLIISGMRSLVFILIISLCLSGCKKDGKIYESSLSDAPPPVYASYYPLTTGSYWIHERFNVDHNGVLTVNGTDSSYVEKDTIIRGRKFSKIFNGVWYLNRYDFFADSL